MSTEQLSTNRIWTEYDHNYRMCMIACIRVVCESHPLSSPETFEMENGIDMKHDQFDDIRDSM